MKSFLIGAGVIILIATFAISHGNANNATIDPSSVPTADIQPVGDTAKDVVDLHYALNPGDQVKSCETLELVGYDRAFDAFALGYDEPHLSATEVFDEMVSRC